MLFFQQMWPKCGWILKRNGAAFVDDSEEREVPHSLNYEAKIAEFEKANIWKGGSIWEQAHPDSLYSTEKDKRKKKKLWVYKAEIVKFSCISVIFSVLAFEWEKLFFSWHIRERK